METGLRLTTASSDWESPEATNEPGFVLLHSTSMGTKARHPASSCPSSSFQSTFKPPENWALAKEFVPKSKLVLTVENGTETPKSYAAVVGPPTDTDKEGSSGSGATSCELSERELCPYAMMGECRYGDQCALIHGWPCDFCGRKCLHPYDPKQREKHLADCVEQHERDMEHSFAVARSSEKTCGICMEVVMEKTPPGEQRFGILPACAHCFCLSCIRKWRQARQFENKIIRACPECRVTSDFVCPSRFWIETKEDKDKLIESYKVALSKKPCRYYKNGSGTCPFGNKCFYLHALLTGDTVDVGPPRRIQRRRNGSRSDDQSYDGRDVSIFDFLEEWELQWMDIDDFMDMLDSDDQSEMSSDLDFD